MKPVAIIFLVLITLTSWKADKKGPWVINNGKRIVLFTRPLNYSKTVSPDSIVIVKIIQEQENAIDYINKRLKTDFNSKVAIYLYNQDEAKEKIGTENGGFANQSVWKPCVYFAYRNEPLYSPLLESNVYVGIHEMVHVITAKKLGNIRTSYFGEGYSNALDGCYGAVKINNRLIFRRNDSTLVAIKKTGKLLTPTELLFKENIPEREFYPQIGCLMNWLIWCYGIDKINLLYPLKKQKIRSEFKKVTGDSFEEMEAKYMAYQNTGLMK